MKVDLEDRPSSDDRRVVAALGAGMRALYQPIVRLSDRRVVAYEALARGAPGTGLETPTELAAAASASGFGVALDWECRRVALLGALEAGLDGGRALFVNVEPGFADSEAPAGLEALVDEALRRFPVVIELTERALTDHPTELLALVDSLRARGARIALDDVGGADPRSLALMPFLRPDVIKLDLAVLQQSPSRESAAVVHAVNAEAEATGALVLAEGIETEAHLRRARALGATHGQGWLFGHPARIEPGVGEPIELAPASERRLLSPATPFEIVTAEKPTRRGDKPLLLELSRSIEAQTRHQGSAAVVLATFQEARYFTPASAARYAELAEGAALVAALGVGLSGEPRPGVRGVSLEAAERLRGEWNVTAVAPHFAAAFVGRDLGDTGPDSERRFDFALTYERDLVVRAARAMMGRIAGLGAGGAASPAGSADAS
jgi:EAL domain-containing protein (putative c-di-GMP-specific phosphodiesterase class I)